MKNEDNEEINEDGYDPYEDNPEVYETLEDDLD